MTIRCRLVLSGCAALFVSTAGPTVKAAGISGFVRDTSSNALQDVWVDVYTSGGSWSASAITQTNGAYAVTNLTSASYYYVRTESSPADYVDEWYSNVVVSSWSIPSSAALVHTGTGITSGISFELAMGGSVTGLVTDLTNRPIADAWVDAYDAAGSYRKSGISDTNGAFALHGLAEGAYYLRTDAYGMNYINEWFNDVPVSGGDTPTNAASLTVVAGMVSGPANFALAPGASIAGTVTSRSLAAISNIWVDLYNSSEDWITSAYCGSGGVYRLTGLSAGTYYLRTDASGTSYSDQWFDNVAVSSLGIPTNATAVTLTTGAARSNVLFHLDAGGVIAGTVTNLAGAGLAGVTVVVYNKDDEWFGQTTTGTGGVYTVKRLPAAGFRLRTAVGETNYIDEWYDNILATGLGIPTQAVPVSVSAGATNSPVNFGLSIGGRLAGVVTDTNGLGLSGIGVEIYDETGSWVKGASSASNGTYLIQGLPAPAAYFAVADPGSLNLVSEWFTNVLAAGTAIPAAAAKLSLIPGAIVSNVDFRMETGGSVAGTVRNQALLPLSGIPVSAYNSDGAWLAQTSTLTNGVYAISQLPAGTVYVRADGNGSNLADQWFSNVTAVGTSIPAGAQPLSVAAGATNASVNFTLAAGGTITGRVTDATTGIALGGIVVDIFSTTNWTKSASTDTSGAYRVTGLATQLQYYARTYVDGFFYADEWFDNVPAVGSDVPASAALVGVSSVSTAKVNFAIDPCGILVGLVRDAAGSAISGITVGAYTTNELLAGSSTTDADGTYQIAQLPGGSYFVETYSGAMGFVDKWYDGVSPGTSGIPTNASSVAVSTGGVASADFVLGFLMSAARWDGAAMQMHWQAASGTTYQVISSSDLASWTNAPSGSNATQQSRQQAAAQVMLEYQDDSVTTNPVYYRVQIEVP